MLQALQILELTGLCIMVCSVKLDVFLIIKLKHAKDKSNQPVSDHTDGAIISAEPIQSVSKSPTSNQRLLVKFPKHL